MNPYRAPGDRSCVVELIEDVLANELKHRAGVDRARQLAGIPPRDEIGDMMFALNMVVGPRLRCTEIRWIPDSILDAISMRIEGRGGVTCDLTIPHRRLYRHGLSRSSVFEAIYEFIMEKLPD